MPYDNLIEQLKTLQRIEADDSFKDSTRRMVLATEPKTQTIPHIIPQWGWAVGIALIMLVVGSSVLFTPTTTVSSFDSDELQAELNTLNIEVDQVTYTQETNRTIASALNEISNTQTNHLHKSILEREQNSLQSIQQDSGSENIDSMLNKIIF